MSTAAVPARHTTIRMVGARRPAVRQRLPPSSSTDRRFHRQARCAVPRPASRSAGSLTTGGRPARPGAGTAEMPAAPRAAGARRVRTGNPPGGGRVWRQARLSAAAPTAARYAARPQDRRTDQPGQGGERPRDKQSATGPDHRRRIRRVKENLGEAEDVGEQQHQEQEDHHFNGNHLRAPHRSGAARRATSSSVSAATRSRASAASPKACRRACTSARSEHPLQMGTPHRRCVLASGRKGPGLPPRCR